MAHFSPSAIFSPTVARQQQAEAKDWSYVDAWLSRAFTTIGKTPPSFERNADTLKALLSLASLNEAADEDCELLCAVERKALIEHQSSTEHDNAQDEILQSLEENLTREGQAALNALSTTSTTLNITTVPTAETLLSSLLDLQTQSFDLAQASDRVCTLDAHLRRELASIEALISDLQSPAYQPSATLPKQTLDHQRKTKHLAAKLPELRDRLAALAANPAANSALPKPSVQELKREEERYREQQAVVKRLETEANGFHGLPHDVDLARLELAALREELKELERERDGLFEGLVERESPKKTRR